MTSSQKVIAVIPARGGSKRIPRKNIRLFSGKPIITYSIEVAQQSGLFEVVYVSTEDEEIARVSERSGASIIERPSTLADDYTPTIPVVRHAISSIEKNESALDAVCCIYPTSPLVWPEDIIAGYRLLQSGNWEFVFSASEYTYPVQRAFRIQKSGSIRMLYPKHFSSRTQDLDTVYHDADKYYWGKRSAWINHNEMFTEKATAIQVPFWRAQAIDTEDDWKRAELIYRQINGAENDE